MIWALALSLTEILMLFFLMHMFFPMIHVSFYNSIMFILYPLFSAIMSFLQFIFFAVNLYAFSICFYIFATINMCFLWFIYFCLQFHMFSSKPYVIYAMSSLQWHMWLSMLDLVSCITYCHSPAAHPTLQQGHDCAWWWARRLPS